METFETNPYGECRFGGAEGNGVGHCLLWESPAYMCRRQGDYEILAMYTPDKVEALAIEVYKQLSPMPGGKVGFKAALMPVKERKFDPGGER
ncbi:MAG: hypothetical protein KAX23_02885 [Dehalococcoidia bacterium]|jgi:hypothetical protein|nr:hypothetical protein [Chloroflexota bacterium]MCK4242476.1 hypothetical protein [Dehalococcoidia bacterium]